MNTEQIIETAIQGHASTRDAIRWAIQQEREACAKVCEEKKSSYEERASKSKKLRNIKPKILFFFFYLHYQLVLLTDQTLRIQQAHIQWVH